jgi:hypothetical protein
MKHLSRLSFTPALVLSLLGLSSLAHAQVSAVPNSLNFQGRLANASGTPVPDGTYSVRFSLWDAVSAGTEKWNKTVANVAVKNGTFAVTLDTFPAGTFNGNLWLEVKIGTDAALAPRTPLVSVPYAMKSDLALTVPDGTLTAAKFAPNALSNAVNSLAWLLGGNTGTNPATQFLGTTDAQPLVFRTNNATRLTINENEAAFTANLKLLDGKELVFADNGQIRSLDDYHRILFRRSENKMELREYGDLIFSPGATAATETAKVVMLANGSVGIGTSTPQSTLEVNGSAAIRGAYTLELGAGVSGKEGSAGRIGYQTFTADALDIVGAGTAADNRKIKFWNEGGAAFVGNLGIGTDTPAAKLDVAGTARMMGLQMPTGAGANKVLVSDAGGNGTWQAVTSAMIQSVDWSQINNVPSGLGAGWILTGNSGINPATQFLGTTDDQPFMVRANNRRVMQYRLVDN